MKLYNTLSHAIEEFEPINPPKVGIYTCGPTVYDYTHIGHLRKYINDDVLVRVLRLSGYEVKHVMNITDVGHLVSDADSGEDKLEKGAKKLGKSVLDTARYFEEDFWKSIKSVNVNKPDVSPRATENIEDQVALIETLREKGYTYQTEEAIYFDVSKFSEYTKLSGQDLKDKITGVRDEVVVDAKKKNPYDFALWFFTVGRFQNHALTYPSPWGNGFPGWHIECSAMSMKYLGFSFDIHTGGVDHIPVHHTNEVAQSEAATGAPFVKYWVHHAFLSLKDEKMSKSKGNIYRISELVSKKFSPLAFRYLTFLTHYRSDMNFSWESLKAAQEALDRIYNMAASFEEPRVGCAEFEEKFFDAFATDLNAPKAISVLWEMLRSSYPTSAKAESLYKMDEILGLKIKEKGEELKNIPQKITDMINERNKLRRYKKFNAADKIRRDIEKLGYIVTDEKDSSRILRKI